MCGGKGGGSKPQVAGTQVVEQRTEFPEEIRPFITDILEKAQARFNEQSGKAMPTFPGGTKARIAEMDPLQEETLTEYDIASRSGLAGSGTNLGSALPYYQSGLSALQDSQQAFGPQQAAQYMNPYQQAVVDVAKREAIRQAQPAYQAIGDRAVSTGGFGGSRQAIAESELNRNLQQQLSDLQTRGSQQAFEQGRAAFEQQKARDAGASARYFAQAPLAYRQQLAELSAREGVGKTRRAEDQRNRNLLYEQFKEEQMYPSRNLAEYQSIVRGFPYQPQMYETKQNLAPAPGLGQQLMGGLGTAGSIYGAMGGFGKGGFGNMFGSATGGQVGGLASLASGGQIQGGGFETHQNNAFNPPIRSFNQKINLLKQYGLDHNDPQLRQMTIEEIEEVKKRRDGKVQEEARISALAGRYSPESIKKMNFPGASISEEGAGSEDLAIDIGGLSSLAPKPKPKVVSPSLTGTTARDISALEGNISPTAPKEAPKKMLSPSEIIAKKAQALIPDLLTPEILADKQKLQEYRKQILSRDPQTMIDKEKTGITKITGKYQTALDALVDEGKTHTQEQTKRWEDYQKGRETGIDKRHKRQMGDLLARGKKAKDRGERNAMSNFWGLMIQGFTQAGQDPRGFMAGMLGGTQQGLNKFLDRHADIVDSYATGEEKRAREKMDINDKRDTSLFDLQDKSQQYLANLADKQYRLTQDMKKEKANVGMTSDYKKLAAELSIVDKELTQANVMSNVLSTSLELNKAERADNRATIEALKDWQDIINDQHGTKTAKAFSAQLTNLDNQIETNFGYTIKEDADGNTIGMIGGNPLTAKTAQELSKAKSDAKQYFLKQLTSGDERDQQEAIRKTFAYIDTKYSSGQGGKRIKFDQQGNEIK